LKRRVRDLLAKIYGGRADVHLDLYRLSNQHRKKHGRGCDMYPSSPLQAPLWSVVASLTHARRMLEVGCGHGYTSAVMASAGGPDCLVETVEADQVHADLAQEAFLHRGLAKRVHVLRGRGQTILPKLKGKYDVVFLDGDWREYPRYLPQLRRLTRPGSILVTANLSPLFGGWGGRLPGKRAIRSYLSRLAGDPNFRTYIIPSDWHAISVRL